MSSAESERRATPRYPVDLRARFWTKEDGEIVAARIINVSWGGLFMQCESIFPPGTPVRLLVGITRPEETVPLAGTVAWAAFPETPVGPGLGIRLDTPL